MKSILKNLVRNQALNWVCMNFKAHEETDLLTTASASESIVTFYTDNVTKSYI